MRRRTLIASLLVAAARAPPALASCVCTCVDGEATSVCDSPLEVAPPCYRICPPRKLEPPPLAPPPLGPGTCEWKQVYDERTGEYVYKVVCE